VITNIVKKTKEKIKEIETFIFGKGRPLTNYEINEAKEVFGDKIDYSKVKIITGKDMTLWGKILTSGGAAVTWGNTIISQIIVKVKQSTILMI